MIIESTTAQIALSARGLAYAGLVAIIAIVAMHVWGEPVTDLGTICASIAGLTGGGSLALGVGAMGYGQRHRLSGAPTSRDRAAHVPRPDPDVDAPEIHR